MKRQICEFNCTPWYYPCEDFQDTTMDVIKNWNKIKSGYLVYAITFLKTASTKWYHHQPITRQFMSDLRHPILQSWVSLILFGTISKQQALIRISVTCPPDRAYGKGCQNTLVRKRVPGYRKTHPHRNVSEFTRMLSSQSCPLANTYRTT